MHCACLTLNAAPGKRSVAASPARLQTVDDRVGLLDRLKRKYGPRLVDVIAHAEACRTELAALQSSDERKAEVASLLHAAETEYQRRAEHLSDRRRAAGVRFARELVSALGDLAMDRTRFEVRFERAVPEAWGPRGLDNVEFFVSPNPGEDLRPLTRVVSGGELSRLMLAIKTLTSRTGKGATLIFDEVDAGIGGHTADVVGRRLQGLAVDSQVLCITHLPQIAAAADQHYRITKAVRGQRTVTEVERLDGEGRRQELARMIAGQSVTVRVLANADEMLDDRRRAKGESKPKGESESRKAKGRT